MPGYDWNGLLVLWSRELINSPGFADIVRYDGTDYPGMYSDDVLKSGWLGYPPATEEQIIRAEARLGTTLPPDYKAFLRVTNGWRWTGTFIPRVRPVEEIDWLRVTDPDMISAWTMGLTIGGAGPADTPEGRHLASTLQVSDRETVGTAVYLLNPEVVTPAGEWEAWFMAHWVPGANLFPSFWELMNAEHASFLNLEAGSR